MARKKNDDTGGPSNAYLISFGDTMTALLAFFIVINSLAQEQTGANLYSGTGSFVSALSSMGLPGKHKSDTSANAFQKQHPGPLYVVADGSESDKGKGSGPDPDGNQMRIVDREKESLQRFIIELNQLGPSAKMPTVKNEIVFDIFEPIREAEPVVGSSSVNLFRQASLQLDGATRIEIIVWASMPNVSAWTRSVNESERLKQYLIQKAGVNGPQLKNIIATGKPWFFSDAKRPRFSIVVTKLKSE